MKINEEDEVGENKKESRVAVWSGFGSAIFLWLVSLAIGTNYGQLLSELFIFFSGDPYAVVVQNITAIEIFRTVLGVVVLNLLCTLFLFFVILLILGRPKGNFEHPSTPDFHMAKFSGKMFLEELVGRWLFLGFLTAVFTSVFSFYFLMVLGNFIWTLPHLVNTTYEKKSKWNFLRVSCVFVTGFFFAFVFIKLGLWVAVMTHITYNTIWFALSRKKKFEVRELWVAIYYVLLLGAGYLAMMAMGLKISDISPWFYGEEIKSLGLGILGYGVLIIFLSTIFDAAASVLFLEQPVKIRKENVRMSVLMIHLSLAVILLLFYPLNYLLGFLIGNEILRYCVMVMIFLSIQRTDNFTAVARLWLANFVPWFLIVCLLFSEPLGFLMAFGVASLGALLELIPHKILTKEVKIQEEPLS